MIGDLGRFGLRAPTVAPVPVLADMPADNAFAVAMGAPPDAAPPDAAPGEGPPAAPAGTWLRLSSGLAPEIVQALQVPVACAPSDDAETDAATAGNAREIAGGRAPLWLAKDENGADPDAPAQTAPALATDSAVPALAEVSPLALPPFPGAQLPTLPAPEPPPTPPPTEEPSLLSACGPMAPPRPSLRCEQAGSVSSAVAASVTRAPASRLAGSPGEPSIASNLPQAGPEPERAAPNLPQAGPEPERAAPNLPQAGPEPERAAPNLPQAGPEPERAAPNLPQAGPEPERAAPDLPQAGPEPERAGPAASRAGTRESCAKPAASRAGTRESCAKPTASRAGTNDCCTNPAANRAGTRACTNPAASRAGTRESCAGPAGDGKTPRARRR